MSRAAAFAAILMILAAGTARPGGALAKYVKPTGSDGNDGSSWALAKRTVQAGLDAAAWGDEVWVAAGTYVQCVTLGEGVALYGGFLGTEGSRDLRDWDANATILDGGGAGSVVTVRGTGTSPSRIDGFTIRNGNTSGNGGGINCQGGSPEIANNLITGNAAKCGGGVAFGTPSKAILIGNVISGNTLNVTSGGYGAGIFCAGAGTLPKIINNLITLNTAPGNAGGGICCYNAILTTTGASIVSNVISQNSADKGGGICAINANSSSRVGVVGNTLVGNTATTGGGIYSSSSSLLLANSICAFNSSGVFRTAGSFVCRYSDLFGNAGYDYSGMPDPSGADGNISRDPSFVSITSDLRLQSGSPCIDAGSNSDALGATDLGGAARILPAGGAVDMGAYEYSPLLASASQFVKFGKWNLVSVPADPVNPDPLAVFAGIDVPNASFQYWKNNADGGGYQLFGGTFGWTGPIERGTPYWFIETGSGSDKQIRYAAISPSADFEMTIPRHAAAPFWVMFGTPFPNATPAMDVPNGASGIRFKNITKRGDQWLSWTDAFSPTNANVRIVDSNAQGWDAANQRFVGVTPPEYFGEKSQFEPWWGYWLLIYDTEELRIKFPKP